MADQETPERTRRWVKALLVLGGLLAVVLVLVGWNRVSSTDRYCASCHAMNNAVASAERSVHADLSCLDCHTRPGLIGSIRYVPALGRELVATTTGWGVANGILAPASCTRCHDDLSSNANLKPAHTTGRACSSCHGDVTHPALPLLTEKPEPVPSGQAHPSDYVTSHGQDVASDPASCTTCHQDTFCETCHFKAVFPHPKDWIDTHGPVEMKQGSQACTSCHPTTFCAGCHGTEIPHTSGWLGEHWRDLQQAPVTPCLLCHPKTDCTTCHAEHDVHTEQGLFQVSS
jgi:hypothetical protein